MFFEFQCRAKWEGLSLTDVGVFVPPCRLLNDFHIREAFDIESCAGELFDREGNVLGTGDGDLEIPSLDHDSDINKLEILAVACTDGGDYDARLAAYLRRYGIPSLRCVSCISV